MKTRLAALLLAAIILVGAAAAAGDDLNPESSKSADAYVGPIVQQT